MAASLKAGTLCSTARWPQSEGNAATGRRSQIPPSHQLAGPGFLGLPARNCLLRVSRSSSSSAAPTPSGACTSHLQRRGHMWRLAPSSARRGGRGRVKRGEIFELIFARYLRQIFISRCQTKLCRGKHPNQFDGAYTPRICRTRTSETPYLVASWRTLLPLNSSLIFAAVSLASNLAPFGM